MGIFGPSKKEKQLQSEIERLNKMLSPEQQEIEKLRKQICDLETTIANLGLSINEKNNVVTKLDSQISILNVALTEKQKQLSVFDTDINVLDYGLYKPSFEFANSDLYKTQLTKLRDMQKQCIKNDDAAYGNTNWQVNGSLSQDRTMVNNYKPDEQKAVYLKTYDSITEAVKEMVNTPSLYNSVTTTTKLTGQVSSQRKYVEFSLRIGREASQTG